MDDLKGNMQGDGSSASFIIKRSKRTAPFCYGPVHALTDLCIAQEGYSSDATTLLLVENRAVLTRNASEKGFLSNMDTIIFVWMVIFVHPISNAFNS